MYGHKISRFDFLRIKHLTQLEDFSPSVDFGASVDHYNVFKWVPQIRAANFIDLCSKIFIFCSNFVIFWTAKIIFFGQQILLAKAADFTGIGSNFC
jgi:hypothetical protein